MEKDLEKSALMSGFTLFEIQKRKPMGQLDSLSIH